MPELSRFFGIIITLYHDDHGPPHFHVRYGNQRALVSIDGLSVIAGELSPRVRGLVVEWRHCAAPNCEKPGTLRCNTRR